MAVPADPRKVGDKGEMGDTGDSSRSRCTGEWAGVRMTDTRASTVFLFYGSGCGLHVHAMGLGCPAR